MQLLRDAAHTAGAAAKGSFAHLGRVTEHRLGFVEEPAEHADAIAYQGTARRIMDSRLDDRTVDAQLAPARHLELRG